MFASHIYKNSGVVSDPNFNNVSLLLHGDGTNGVQNNTFLDSSTNNFTITRNGTPTQGSFSPFALNGVAYSPTLHGGSGYFNGTTDYLNAPNSNNFVLGTNDATIEFWMYTLRMQNYDVIFINRITTNSEDIFMHTNADGSLSYYESGVLINSGVNSIQTNTWTHVAIVRTSGTRRLYINGTKVGPDRTATTVTSNNLTLGCDPAGSATRFNGYLSNFRYVKGAALYTSNFTPPTSPVTLTLNGGATPSTAPTSGQVSLLCNFTNAGIFDNTKKNVLTTVGNARVSTSVVKFGTGSMYFDGTGDYLTMPDSNNFALGTGNATIEFWIYPTALIQDSTIFAISTTANSNDCYLQMSSGGALNYRENGVNISTANLLNTNTWTHIAIARNGGTRTVYVNGTSAVTGGTANITSNRCSVGAYSSGTLPIQGYIDDLRITKGIARYTANFTPPTQAFPNI